MFENLIVTKLDGYVATVQLNRPKVLNALSLELMTELCEALEMLDKDNDVRTIVIHGNERAFAAGADITQMAQASSIDMLNRDQFSKWEKLEKLKNQLLLQCQVLH